MDPPPPSPSSTGTSSPMVSTASAGDSKSKEEKLKDLYQELEKLQSSLTVDESAGEPVGRYANRWNEDDWEKDFETHPIFMSKPPENPEELPGMVEAMRQLKFDPEFNSKTELALTYKKEGNENFRLKKYHWAIDSFTAGIKQQSDDNQLNSQLFANRAACHFRLGNYRTAVKDSMTAIKFNPDNKKAVIRVADSLVQLKKYKECTDFCKALKSKHPELEDYLIKCLKELVGQEDIRRAEKLKEKEEDKKKDKLMKLVNERGIKTHGNLFESLHPAASNFHVEMTADGQLVWPVIFVYPEYSQTDFIQEFHEDTTFEEQLQVLLGDPNNRPAWDTQGKYVPGRTKIGFPNPSTQEMIPVDPKKSLKDILCSPNFILIGANPVFTILASK